MWVSGRKCSSNQWLDCCSWTQKPEPKQLCIVPSRKESNIWVDVISHAALWRKSVPKPKMTRWPKSFGKSVNDWAAFHKARGTVLLLVAVCELYLSLKGEKNQNVWSDETDCGIFMFMDEQIFTRLSVLICFLTAVCTYEVFFFFNCIKVSNGITIILVGSLLYELWNYIWYEGKTPTNVSESNFCLTIPQHD